MILVGGDGGHVVDNDVGVAVVVVGGGGDGYQPISNVVGGGGDG